mgnify:CR=1 FL=1
MKFYEIPQGEGGGYNSWGGLDNWGGGAMVRGVFAIIQDSRTVKGLSVYLEMMETYSCSVYMV